MQVFVSTPEPPYQVGDLWAQGSSGELLRCKTEKKAGEIFAKDDWEKASSYTNDDYAKKVEKALGDLKTTSEANFKQYASNFTLIDTSLVNLGNDLSGVSLDLTTGLANADKNAQTYASNAKTGAESTAKGYANAAENSAKEAAQEYANTAESNATTYAESLVG
jgi:phage-related protein